MITMDDLRTGGSSSISEIELSKIQPNPEQPRSIFEQETLEELAASIRSIGIIQPITLKEMGDDRYMIISGERRYRASLMAGLERIPAYIRTAEDDNVVEMALIENIQREDLNAIEIALAYQKLLDNYNLTQEALSERVGKKRASVTNYLRLLKLPAKVQHDLKVGLLSVGHAKVLLGIEDESIQEKLCDLVIKDGLSVRQLEDRIRKAGKEEPSKTPQEQELPDDYFKVLEIVGKYFGNSISLKRSSTGKGTMTIHFSSDEEISRFLKALENSSL